MKNDSIFRCGRRKMYAFIKYFPRYHTEIIARWEISRHSFKMLSLFITNLFSSHSACAGQNSLTHSLGHTCCRIFGPWQKRIKIIKLKELSLEFYWWSWKDKISPPPPEEIFWFWPQESRAAAAGAALPRSIYADKNAEDKKKKKVESCF